MTDTTNVDASTDRPETTTQKDDDVVVIVEVDPTLNIVNRNDPRNMSKEDLDTSSQPHGTSKLQQLSQQSISVSSSSSSPTTTSSMAGVIATTASSKSIFEQIQEYKELGNIAFESGNRMTSTTRSIESDSKNTEQQQQQQYQQAVQYYTRGIDLLLLQQQRGECQAGIHPDHHNNHPKTKGSTVSNNNDNNSKNIDGDDVGSVSAITSAVSSLPTTSVTNGAENATTAPPPPQVHPSYSNLLMQLYSNRALVYIKLQQSIYAEEDCCRVLDWLVDDGGVSGDSRFLSKVWYRRGLAREQHAQHLLLQLQQQQQQQQQQEEGRSPKQQQKQEGISSTVPSVTRLQHYVDSSKSDLQRCIQVASNTTISSTTTTTTFVATSTNNHNTATMSPKEIQLLKQQVIPVVQRLAQIQKKVITLRSVVPTTTSTITSATTTAMVTPSLPPIVLPPPPSLSQQKIHIMDLLISRSSGTTGSNQRPNHIPNWITGEAYFILNWNWWCTFCDTIQLFTNNSDNNRRKTIMSPDHSSTTATTKAMDSNEDIELLLSGLPPGAILPDPIRNDDDDEEEEEEDVPSGPGPIDNTSLLLLLPSKQTSNQNNNDDKTADHIDRIYNKHWFRQYYILNDTTTASSLLVNEADNNKNHDDWTNNTNGDSNSHPIPSSPTSHQNNPMVPVRPNLVRGYHYEIIPREVYYALRLWYTEVTPPICRRVVEEKHEIMPNNGNRRNLGPEHRPYLPLYPLLSTSTSNATPAIPIETTPNKIVSNNKVGKGECGNCGATNVTLRCRNCMSIYYCDRACQESDWNTHKNECKTASLPQQRLVRARGRTGLNNLGNTCFMNSAIQCLSHATPLTRHFLSGRYQSDINRTNPLGTGGQLAVAYAETIKLLHHTRTTGTSSISPIKLKHAIAMFAPRFAGFLQHDAQEFLAYLLDGLHEDVNRIRNAPYVEMPDVTDGQCIAIAGANAWEAHRKRNDSVVLDTFYGQFKSTCVCPKCQRVSVSFDVYNHVSLEIPQETNDNIPMVVIVYAAPRVKNPFPKPTRFAVSIRRNTNLVSDLKHALSALCHISSERLHICEEHHGTVTVHEDKRPLSTFRNTVLIAYDMHPLHASSEESDPVFHTVLTNHLVVPDESSTTAMEQSEPVVPTPTTLERIGIPILTSFDASYTCREVWNHIWSFMDFYVSRKDEPTQNPIQPSPMDVVSDFDVRQLLQIRLVVQSSGKERPVFPMSSDNSTELNSNANAMEYSELVDMMDTGTSESETITKQISYTSILPRDSDETLLKYVGIDQLRNFVFFDCVWSNPVEETTDDGEIDNEEKVEAQAVIPSTTKNMYNIDEDRFYIVMNDSSYLEYIRKSKESASKKVVTLDECLDTFTRPERLDVQNMWYCSRCKDHVQALKTMELWKLPNVLIIHLKRFEYKHSLRRDKLDQLVDFPLYGLDMNQHCGKYNNDHKTASCVDSYVPAIYDCFAVVNHYGRMGFGHYTAYARSWNEDGFISSSSTSSNPNNRTSSSAGWNLFDDSQVRTVHDERSVVSSAAYVLLYRRRIFH